VTDATTAAKAIQAEHTVPNGYCAYCDDGEPCPSREDAGVVLAQLNEAIEKLVGALGELDSYEGEEDREGFAYANIKAAMACLRGEDS
jgi:hypothetical protein